MLISRGRKRSERPRIRLIDEILHQDETDEKKYIKSPRRLPKEEYRRKINEVINSDSDGKPFRMLVFRGRKRSERPRIRLIDEILHQDETDEKKNIKSPRRLPKIRSLEGHRQRVGCLAWRGQSLTSGSQDKSIINHDVRARSSLTSCIQGHAEEVCGLKWSSKGNQLASGGNDNIVCVWEASNMGSSRSTTRFTDHCAAVKALAWCRYQCDILASGDGSDDQCIKIWNSQTGKINEVINSDSDGKHIMLVFRGRKRSERPRIQLIDEILHQDETDEKKNMKSPRRLPKSGYRVLDAQRLNDNFYMNLIDWGSNNVLVVGLVTQLYLWNSDGKPFRMLVFRGIKRTERPRIRLIDEILHQDETDEKKNIKSPSRLPKIRSLEGHRQRVGCLAWRGQSLTSGSQDKSIINHDVRARSSLTSCIRAHTEEVCGLKWSSKGNQLASGGTDNVFCVWEASNMDSSRSMTRCSDHCAAVKALAWCPYQHDILASGGGSDDRSIKIRNSQTGKCMNSIDTESQICGSVRPRIRLIDEILHQDETEENKIIKSPRRLPKKNTRFGAYGIVARMPTQEGEGPSDSLSSPLLSHSTAREISSIAARRPLRASPFNDLPQPAGGNSSDPPRDNLPPSSPLPDSPGQETTDISFESPSFQRVFVFQ